jgi:hypothetical protein
MFLFGLFAADGTYKNNGQMSISFNEDDKELIGRAREILKKEFNVRASEYRTSSKCVILQFSSVQLLSLFEFGKKEMRKFPEEFMFYPPELQFSLYEGYFSGDGFQDKRGNNITATISRNLANQIQIILLRNNKTAKLRKVKRQRYGRKTKDQYWVEWKEKPHNNLKCRIEGDYLVSAIQDFKESNYEGLVYNLEVEDDESYVSESIIVHNCVISLGLANFIARHLSMGIFAAVKGSQRNNPFLVKT